MLYAITISLKLTLLQDIGSQEFLVNYGGPLDDPWILDTKGHYGPFYEYFEPQWWITDFGESVLFEPNSDPTARKVVGLCAGKLTYPIAHYPKVSPDTHCLPVLAD